MTVPILGCRCCCWQIQVKSMCVCLCCEHISIAFASQTITFTSVNIFTAFPSLAPIHVKEHAFTCMKHTRKYIRTDTNEIARIKHKIHLFKIINISWVNGKSREMQN